MANNLDRLDQAHARLTDKMRRVEEAMLKVRQREKDIASLDENDRAEVAARFPGMDRK